MRAVIAVAIAVPPSRADRKMNCQKTLEMNADRVQHFKKRITELGLTVEESLIVILNVDDEHGGPLADVFMPNQNWQVFRDRGEVPFARGLVRREGIDEALEFFDKEAAYKLRAMADKAVVVVVDFGVAEVFPA